MGFNSTASTIVLTARLTPIGRQKLLTNDSTLITKFSLGDSDANYFSDKPLGNGEIPVIGGNLTINSGTTSNSSANDIQFRSTIFASSGVIFDFVQPGSTNVLINETKLGQKTISGTSLNQILLDRNDLTTPSSAITSTSQFTNYFYSLSLPITNIEKNIFSGVSVNNGGYSNTGISNLNKDNVWLISIPKDEYGEILDGKELKIKVSNGTEFNVYGTFEKTLTRPDVLDKFTKETSLSSRAFGSNMVFLFSDEVRRPNSATTKSWSTGFGDLKPFSIGNKERFNLASNPSINQVEDTVVGIAKLDSGLIAITDETIISGITGGSFNSVTGDTEVTFNTVSTEVQQNILLVLDRGKFAISNNPTFSQGDNVRISEIGLFDNNNDLIAIAKPSQHIEKRLNDFLSIEINIIV